MTLRGGHYDKLDATAASCWRKVPIHEKAAWTGFNHQL